MCTCANCKYTDGFSGKGFAEWPRGEPAGPRASAAAYAAHVSHLWKGVPRKAIAFTPGQAPQYPSWCSTKSMAPAVLKIPEGCESLAEYVADFDKLNGLKRQEPVKAPARPATISKSPQHFPELDRQPEAIPSVSKAYRVAYSANDIEELDMRFMSVAQASKEWDISQPRIRQWLADGRVKGAQKIGRDWLIPASAIRPKAAKPGELMAARA
jgi:hypothetical protein